MKTVTSNDGTAIAFDRAAPGLEALQGSVLAPDGEPHGERLSPGGPRRWRRFR